MYRLRGTKRTVRTTPAIFGIAILFALLLASPPVHAAQLTLGWNAVSYSQLSGYCLSYGTKSGSYTTNITLASNATSYTVTGLADSTTYYLAVKACSTAGDSSYSNQVSANTPTPVVNHAPVVTAGSLSTKVNTAATGTMQGSDQDGNTLTFSVVTAPAHGSVSVTNASTGAFRYTPTSNYSGSDSFTFRASDGQAQSNTATESITITAVNHAPVASAGSLSTTVNTAATGTMQGSDQDGNALTFSVVTAPAHGSVSVTNASTGAFRYTPTSNYSGNDSFTFKVSDGQAQSNTATVSITVTAPATNNPPVASALTLQTELNTPVSGLMSGSDADKDALTYSIASNPAKGTVKINSASTGSFTYTPSTGFTGTDSFTYKVSDGKASSSAATITIKVGTIDTDKDGLSDTDEINVYKTDPQNPDTDGDGFSDGIEVAQGFSPTDPSQPVITTAINVGGKAFTGTDGIKYEADQYFKGGTVGSKSLSIAGTNDDTLFNQYRYGSFSYAIPVPNGKYIVKLRMAEIYWSYNGARVFDVSAEGEPVLNDVDIYKLSGGKAIAKDIEIPVTVSDGTLNLDFFPLSDNALVSAIIVAGAAPEAHKVATIGINVGGPEYVDEAGNIYLADSYFSGGNVSSKSNAIASTTDDALYNQYRYGNMSYAIPVSNGDYRVTLKFAEIYWDWSGTRMFDVSIEGILALNDLDIYAEAGKNTALDYTFDVNVTDGTLNIAFVSGQDNALVNAILIQQM